MTLNNQTAYINVGQEISIITSNTITATGLSTTNIERRQIGVLLQVTPTISPDGSILMRVVPEVSAAEPTPQQLGNGQIATVLDIRHLETTILAQDGETVAIGGMISKRDAKSENKIPVLGDLPLVGAAFRYRTQARTKTEVLIILTPHVIRCAADADMNLAVESKRMDWVLGDVVKIHGTTGLDPIFGPPPELGIFSPGLVGGACPAGPVSTPASPGSTPAPPKKSKPAPATSSSQSSSLGTRSGIPRGETLPSARVVNASAVPKALPKDISSPPGPPPEPIPVGTFASDPPAEAPASIPAATSSTSTTPTANPDSSNSTGTSADTTGADPDNPRKESWKWNFFHKK
jgi:hypothetical protein